VLVRDAKPWKIDEDPLWKLVQERLKKQVPTICRSARRLCPSIAKTLDHSRAGWAKPLDWRRLVVTTNWSQNDIADH
jgi:hypothetical protein